jgi:hypothetical protein
MTASDVSIGELTSMETWNYGTVTVVFDTAFSQIVVLVANTLPENDGDFDAVELDWLACCGDLKNRYGSVPNIVAEDYSEDNAYRIQKLRMPAAN